MAVKDNGAVETCLNLIREMSDAVKDARRAFMNSDACVVSRSYLDDRSGCPSDRPDSCG